MNISVEAHTTMLVLNRVETALSPLSLEAFLDGYVAFYLKERASNRFSKGGDDAVGEWEPLSEYTIAQRHREGWPGGPPMFKSGDLHDWIIKTPAVAQQDLDGATLHFPGRGDGEQNEKMIMAQKGLDPNPRQGWKPVPPRPVVGLSATDNVGITALFGEWLEDSLNSSFALVAP